MGGERIAAHYVIVCAVTIEIAMPFWGDINLFKNAVQSVLEQTDPDWHLIIIDDAYPSEEPERWVTEIGDQRISYVRNSVNTGINANFQKSLDLATQDRITIMGCDDILLPEYVARVRQLAAISPADIIQPGKIVIDEHGEPCLPLADRVKRWIQPSRPTPFELTGERLTASLSHGDWLYFPSLSWNTQRAREFGFHQEYRVVLDIALVFDLALSGSSLLVDDVPVFAYRRHRSSVSSAKAIDGSRFIEERTYLNSAADRFAARGWRRAARAARLRWSSRLNAAVALPQAIMSRDGAAIRTLLRHCFGR